jgi:hypothetical protein
MTSTTQELYKSSNGDTWHLERLEDGPLFVIHQANTSSGRKITRTPATEFLKQNHHCPERDALVRALSDETRRAHDAEKLDEVMRDAGKAALG